MYSHMGGRGGRGANREVAHASGNCRTNASTSTGVKQNAQTNCGPSRDAERAIPAEDSSIKNQEDVDMYVGKRWTPVPNQPQPLRKLATKEDAIKELEKLMCRIYGWDAGEPETPELPWRDDRTEEEKNTPEPDYYCCPYSRERPVRLLTGISRPIPPGPGVPFQRGQVLRRTYHSQRRRDNISLPSYLRNGS